MAHHKRRRVKSQRMFCDCKSWKDERSPKTDRERLTPSERRRVQVGREERT